MHVFHLNLLQAAGGAVVEKYKRLVAAADASAAGSRAEEDLQKFFKEWERDPIATAAAAEAEASTGGPLRQARNLMGVFLYDIELEGSGTNRGRCVPSARSSRIRVC